MHRRAAVALLVGAGAIVFAPFRARSQGKPARVGLLAPDEEPGFTETVAGLTQGLRDQGYRDGTVEIIERRTRRDDDLGLRARVRMIVARQPAVLFVAGSSALPQAAREIASQMPIVFSLAGDPVAAGLVTSLAAPGGNMTGVMLEYPALWTKRLELLREVAPNVKRVLALFDARDSSPRANAAAARSAAAALGMALSARDVRDEPAITRAVNDLDQGDALLGIPGGVPSLHQDAMIRAANAKRVPTIFSERSLSTREALLTYGASDMEVARQAARAIDKILKGANAGTLPVERPTKLILAVNVKTANAIKLTMPRTVLSRADQVVE